MNDRDYFEEYTVGEKFITPGRTITETDIALYAGLTGDWHPLHTDAEYAKQGPFGERVAHGLLNLIISATLSFRLGYYAVVPKSVIALLGIDKFRLLLPVKIGDTIHTEIEVLALLPKDEKRGIMVQNNVAKNQRGEEVLVFTTQFIVGRKPQ